MAFRHCVSIVDRPDPEKEGRRKRGLCKAPKPPPLVIDGVGARRDA